MLSLFSPCVLYFLFLHPPTFFFFFFNDTATTEIYTLSLHDALPICPRHGRGAAGLGRPPSLRPRARHRRAAVSHRSEEHTSELQSRLHLVCRLLLEKKKKKHNNTKHYKKRRSTKASHHTTSTADANH